MAVISVQNLRFEDMHSRRILVALSGGADSVALLHLLHDRREADDLTLAAAHFHHGIRGAEADADAGFCRELCAGLNIEYFEGRCDVPRLAGERHAGLETAAREARYGFLRKVQADWGADAIALAHHLNDQAETILMHLLRGAGPDGICGMARLKNGLYRPLLEIPKEALMQYLEDSGISWREDATNRISDTPRNALRLNVLPEIEKSYPQAMQAIARYGRLARIESETLDRQAGGFLHRHLQTGPYGARILLDSPWEEALLRRAVRKIAGGDLPMQKMDEIISLANKSRGRMEISGSMAVEKTPDAIYFLPKPEIKPQTVPLKIPGVTILPGICRILAEEGDFPIVPGNTLEEILDGDKLAASVVRLRRDGDRIHPLGAPGDRLLSDYLTDKKIDRPLRNCMPVVAIGGRILWACGAGISHEARITKDTRRKVRLSIESITDEEPEV